MEEAEGAVEKGLLLVSGGILDREFAGSAKSGSAWLEIGEEMRSVEKELLEEWNSRSS